MPYQPDRVEVLLADAPDTPIIVLADQRDLAAWEACPINDPDRSQPVTATRWVAFHAMQRNHQLPNSSITWDRFNTELCLKASVVNEPAADEGEEGDEGPLEG